jgi:hypothetical protein
LGSLAYEIRRTVERWNHQFRVSEKVDEVKELFREQLKRIDHSSVSLRRVAYCLWIFV